MFLVKVTVNKSDIHGLGMFSKGNIQSGQIVWESNEQDGDLIFTEDELLLLSKPNLAKAYPYIWPNLLTGMYHLATGLDKYMNHSDTPNLSIKFGGRPTKVRFVAKQSISPNMELTYNCRDLGDYDGFFQRIRKACDLASNPLDVIIEKK